MKLSTKKMTSMLKGVVASTPVIPLIMRPRRRTSWMAYVIGGIGIAMVGGVAALMFFSPKTRHRAFDAAKGTYGKVNEKLGHLRRGEPQVEDVPISNGLAGGDYGTSTGI